VTGPVLPKPAPDGVLRDGYETGGFFDEAFEAGPAGAAAPNTWRSKDRTASSSATDSGSR
jgi:hypothetical protein